MQKTIEEQLTLPELCDRLKVKPSWVYRQVREKNIPYRRAGKYLRFQWSAIDDWMQRQAE